LWVIFLKILGQPSQSSGVKFAPVISELIHGQTVRVQIDHSPTDIETKPKTSTENEDNNETVEENSETENNEPNDTEKPEILEV